MPADIEHIVNIPDCVSYDHFLSPAVRLGDTLYLSGQTPRNDQGEMLTGEIEELTEQCLVNLEKVLKHAGASMKDMVKLMVFLKDMNDFPRVNTVFQRVLPTPKPARSCIQVARNPGDARIEIEGIARAP